MRTSSIHRRVAGLGALCLLVLLSTRAHAGSDSVDGDGWRVEVPEGFERAPEAVEGMVAGAMEFLMEQGDFPVGGETEARVFVLARAGELEATFAVLRFGADGEVPTASSISLDELTGKDRKGPLAGLANLEVHAERVVVGRPAVPAVSVTSGQPSTGRTSRTVVVPRRDFLVAVSMTTLEDGTDRWQSVWDRALGTLQVTGAAPGSGFPRWAVFGAIGAAVGAIGWFLVSRSRKADVLVPAGVGGSAYLASGGAFPGAAEASSPPDGGYRSGIRAIDGLGTFRAAAAAPPPPPAASPPLVEPSPAPATAGPAATAAPRPVPVRRPTSTPPSVASRPPALRRDPVAAATSAPLEPSRATFRSPAATAPAPAPVPAAPPAPDAPAKIRVQRNRDFLGS